MSAKQQTPEAKAGKRKREEQSSSPKVPRNDAINAFVALFLREDPEGEIRMPALRSTIEKMVAGANSSNKDGALQKAVTGKWKPVEMKATEVKEMREGGDDLPSIYKVRGANETVYHGICVRTRVDKRAAGYKAHAAVLEKTLLPGYTLETNVADIYRGAVQQIAPGAEAKKKYPLQVRRGKVGTDYVTILETGLGSVSDEAPSRTGHKVSLSIVRDVGGDADIGSGTFPVTVNVPLKFRVSPNAPPKVVDKNGVVLVYVPLTEEVEKVVTATVERDAKTWELPVPESKTDSDGEGPEGPPRGALFDDDDSSS
ncbi:hypothetical protein DIPPA_02806 [Diplonema papillatum]|nr:hypothetical protein DIPPA_17457 [Diplonema papillatum]KAJ9449107.1 hypothetical protein DIPPA_00499 [Diplonema papillatum]KAJ9450095.1 hypothetical protein DIPPA_09233 [Diplonema papillatum]KAJ9460360.1 hypothetical protein DIPPA_02806 [Diplonema papillatum]